MDMAFTQAGAGNLDEGRAFAQILERSAAGISHRRLYAARPADPETSAPRAPFTTTVAGPLPKPSVGPVGGEVFLRD